MPKIITPAMRAHLDAETTRLCTAWRIERRDGQSFFFTDHDRDLVCGGNTYLTATASIAPRSAPGTTRSWSRRRQLPVGTSGKPGVTRPMPFCGACGGGRDDVMAPRGRDRRGQQQPERTPRGGARDSAVLLTRDWKTADRAICADARCWQGHEIAELPAAVRCCASCFAMPGSISSTARLL